MIILRHGKFISGLRVFRAGDVLPDTPTARELVKKALAEIVADTPKKSAKSVKKSDPATVPEKVEPVQENVKSDP